MPFPVACRCGQRFMAPDELAGQQVPCPSCSQPIAIQRPAAPAFQSPQRSQPAPQAMPSATVEARCHCGKAYNAPASAAGQVLRCPACGNGVQVPFAQQPAPQAAPQPAAFDPFNTNPLGGAPGGFPGGPMPGMNQPAGFWPPGFGAPGYPAAPGYPGQGYPGQAYPQAYTQPGFAGGAGVPGTQPSPPAKNQTALWVGLGVGGGVLALGLIAMVAFALSGSRPAKEVASAPPAAAAPATALPAATSTAASSPTGLPAPANSTTSPTGASTTTPGASVPSTAFKPPVSGPEPMPATTAATSAAPAAAATNTNANAASPGTNVFASATPATNASAASPASLAPASSAASSVTSSGAFETSLSKWHQAARAPFSGLRKVGNSEIEQMHFSWMVELLPYLNHRQAYDKFRFDKPLTDGVNMRAAREVIPEFTMPGDDRTTWKGYPFQGLGLTHFAGMSGVEDARNVVAAKLPRSDPRAGVFGYKEVAKANEITDGTSQTIMIVGSGKLANPWAMGGGATIRGAREPYFDSLSGLGTKGAQAGSLVVMADGSVRHVSSKVDPKVFRAMCTIHGADSFDLETTAPRSALK